MAISANNNSANNFDDDFLTFLNIRNESVH